MVRPETANAGSMKQRLFPLPVGSVTIIPGWGFSFLSSSRIRLITRYWKGRTALMPKRSHAREVMSSILRIRNQLPVRISYLSTSLRSCAGGGGGAISSSLVAISFVISKSSALRLSLK